MHKEKHNLADHRQTLGCHTDFWWNYYVIAAKLVMVELLPKEQAS